MNDLNFMIDFTKLCHDKTHFSREKYFLYY